MSVHSNPLVQRLETEVKDFRHLQKEANQLQTSRSQYLTQLNENEMVKKELELIEDNGGMVYKLIGPALIKQEKPEAIANVAKRIDFISNEMKRIESTSKDLEKKQEEKRKKIIELQTAVQSQTQPSK